MEDPCQIFRIPHFYFDLLFRPTSSEFRIVNTLMVTNIENEILWNNINIIFDNQVLHFNCIGWMELVLVWMVLMIGCMELVLYRMDGVDARFDTDCATLYKRS